MTIKTIINAALLLAASVQAHMALSVPPPYRSKDNKNADPNKLDYSLTSPLSGAASYPCKGYLTDVGTPAGASVADWAAGASASFSITGGASHGGGSCQVALKTGSDFKVIHSYIGNCPTSSGGSFDFKVPADTPAGPAVFAWTWFNKIGNREMYMDCASVTVTGASKIKRQEAVAFASRPALLVANIGTNSCKTVEGKDVVFPDPGPDVTGSTSGDSGLTGDCGPSGSSPAGGNSSTPAASKSSSAAPKSTLSTVLIVPVNTTASVSPLEPSTKTSGSSQSASGTSSSPASTGTGVSVDGLTPTVDGQCGNGKTCKGSAFGKCCSASGFCGLSEAHCGTGCNPQFGNCGSSSN